MEIIRVREKIYQRLKAPSVALGNFDGVHRGHQEILKRAVESAHRDNRDAVVYTFDPHPRVVLNKAPEIPRITTLSEREEILEHLGIDVLILAEFSLEFAAQSPVEFAENLLKEELGAREVFVGENYRFGKDRAGTAQSLKDMGPDLGFRVHVVPTMVLGEERISSSRIRDHLVRGEIREANRLLGREFTIEGRVIHGHHRGKGLGFPTANLKPAPKLHPPDGVYAGFCRVRGTQYPSVMNIGRNPTFNVRKVSYEAHILDFNEDLYGETIKVYLVDRLRPELKFSDVEQLKTQIQRDVERGKGLLTVLPRFP